MKTTENATQLAKALVSSLREKNVDMSLGEGLKIIATLTGHPSWQTLRHQLRRDQPQLVNAKHRPARRETRIARTDFDALFPDAVMPPCGLEPGAETRHPFPRELEGIPELATWRECWEANALSTRDKHFFPPMLPTASLISSKVTIEFRRDWHLRSNGQAVKTKPYHFDNGTCGVLFRDDQRKIIGATFWKWWGALGRINGVCYGLYLLTEAGWLYIAFDLRARYPAPSAGPVVMRGDTEQHLKEIEAGLQHLAKLRVFRYAS